MVDQVCIARLLEVIPVRAGRVHLAGVARWCMSYVAVTAHKFESVTIGMQLDAVMILSVGITATQSQPRLMLAPGLITAYVAPTKGPTCVTSLRVSWGLLSRFRVGARLLVP